MSVPFPAKYPTMNSSWLKIGPEALYWGPRNVAKVWNASDIYRADGFGTRRAPIRRIYYPAAHAQAERIVLPGGRRAKPACVVLAHPFVYSIFTRFVRHP